VILALLLACGGPDALDPDLADPAALPACGPAAPVLTHRTLTVALWAGGVPEAAARRALARADAVWSAAGVHLVATGPVRPYPQTSALTGDADPAAGAEAAIDALAAPLAALDPGDADLGLLVTRHVVDPSHPFAAAGLTGLTLTRGRARPLVLLGWDDLHAAGGTGAALTPAHEVGHALGLPHADDPRDLMAPLPPPCRPVPAAPASATLPSPEAL
jgi:hypothetical protein